MLDFDGVTKRFGSVTALDGCTFTARPGRLTGFLGPNAAGKTTAMRAVFGLVALDAGTVRWQGTPASAAERTRFGYMPEERGLYPRMRVRDQLVYLGQLCGRAAKDVGRSVDAWLERLGLAARAADRLDSLSHGNQQRVQLIAALVAEPDLLVLDEPFAGLDPLAMDARAGWQGRADQQLKAVVTGAIRLAATAGTRITTARWHRTRMTTERRTTMTKPDLTSHRLLITVLTGTAIALAMAVAVLTSDVIIGVIAGAGFFAIAVQMVKLWTGHSGPPAAHH